MTNQKLKIEELKEKEGETPSSQIENLAKQIATKIQSSLETHS